MEFEELYALHFTTVYRFALSLCGVPSLAEEIAQETFFRAMTALKDFRGQCAITTWLLRIARNQYFAHLRKHKGQTLCALAETLPDPGSVEEAVLDKEDLARIHRCLHALEEPYREVFTLRVFGELSHAQIGALFEKTEAWARVMYYRAKVKLQERMREE